MGCYLIRYAETGRESQQARQALRRDIIAELRARVPDAGVHTDVGRIFVETDLEEAAALAALGALHGPTSFSKTVRCSLAQLEPAVRALAAASLRGRRSFAVRVRRVGAHDFTSAQMARRLGHAILAERPGLMVDLKAPEVRIGVEIRNDDCYLYDAVHPGLDRRP